MRRSIAMGLALLAAGTWAGAATPAPFGGGCVMNKTEPGLWCEKCSKPVEASDLSPEKTHKVCSEKPREVTLCLKKAYECEKCLKHTRLPEKCDGKKPHEVVDKQLVVVGCEGCGVSAIKAEELKHKDSCKKKKTTKPYCANVGFLHTD